MKNVFVIAVITMSLFSCKDKTSKIDKEVESTAVAEDASKKEVDQWKVLFNGTSIDGWKGYLTDAVPEHWKLEEGALVFYPPKDRKEGESFNLVTKDEYTDFVLSLEWKISEGGNSGIFWGVKEIPSLTEAYQSGPEIQVLDNLKHPDAKNGTSHQAGALYDMVSPSKDVVRPVGEWNTCVITINHKTNTGNVVLNGEEVVAFPVNNPEWSAMVAKSKFATWEHFGKYTTGKIGLQDHSDMVSYRNIKIKEL